VTLLHHEALRHAMQAERLEDRLVVMPLLDDSQIGPASIDLRLGTEFIELHRLERSLLDPFVEEQGTGAREERVAVPLGGNLVLHPGQFVLGGTLEFLSMPRHLAGEVMTRSSWARVGLIVATAVFVQPGFAGVLTLEMVNMGSVPMLLRPGLRLGQLVVFTLPSATDHSYLQAQPKYVAPLRPEGTRLGAESVEVNRLAAIGKRLIGAPPTTVLTPGAL
jgi:dCTP deaminase